MRFIYTAPRYHTNQHFPIKALLEAGHEVSFLALARGQSEEYTALSPTVLGYSAAYDTLRRLVGRAKVEHDKGSYPEDRNLCGDECEARCGVPLLRFTIGIRIVNIDKVVVNRQRLGKRLTLGFRPFPFFVPLVHRLINLPSHRIVVQRCQYHRSLPSSYYCDGHSRRYAQPLEDRSYRLRPRVPIRVISLVPYSQANHQPDDSNRDS